MADFAPIKNQQKSFAGQSSSPLAVSLASKTATSSPPPNGLSAERLSFSARSSMNPMKPEQKKYAIPSVAVNLGLTGEAINGNDPADLRQRGITDSYCKDHHVSGIITPFRKPHFTVISKIVRVLRPFLQEKRAKRIIVIIVFVIFSMSCFFSLCKDSHSTALTAYTYISILDLSLLLTCLLSVWVEQQRPTSTFTFGYGRFEVVAVFACTVLAIIGALVVFKECLEQLFQSDKHPVDGNKMLLGSVAVLIYRLIVIHCTDSKAWSHVFISSKSSWLQLKATDVCETLCQLFPSLNRYLLPRLNPFVLMAHLGAVTLLLAQFLIQLKGYYTADTIAGIFIACLMWTTMFPMFMYVGLILLQTTPAHVVSHLDKCLREAATLEGVLEFRNEHFWTLSFGVLAGSIHVRVRRDANEQLVLAHLTNRLSTLVPVLTIQVMKDDWNRSTTLQLQSDRSRAGSSFSHQTPSTYRVAPLSNPQSSRLPVTGQVPWKEGARSTLLSSPSSIMTATATSSPLISLSSGVVAPPQFQANYSTRNMSEFPAAQVS